MVKKRIIILGAGLNGLSVAWHLQQSGIECHVFEKEETIGGLCRSKKINGFSFDYSGHLLHFRNRYTFNLVKYLLGNNLIEQKRSAWIYANKRYIPYPFQAHLYSLPAKIREECLAGLIEASKNCSRTQKQKNIFLDWINGTFGKGIAKHFLIPYNTKFWTVDPQEMTCEWLDGFIPVPSMKQMFEGAVKDSKREFGYNAKFWYPKKGGIASLSNALASGIKNIRTNCEVTGIDLRKKEIILSGSGRERFDCLISTIPLPEIPMLINGIPKKVLSSFDKLKWNSIFNLNLGLNNGSRLQKHWIYFPEKRFSFFRVGFFHNFSTNLAPQSKSSLYIEVSYPQNKRIDNNSTASSIKDGLREVGILDGNKISAQDINEIRYAYPIYNQDYGAARSNILDFLKQKDIISCGRYGSWKYLSMEDTILEGRAIAGKIADI